MNEKLFKTQKYKPHLLADVIKDQDFTWNKYVNLFLSAVSALINVNI